MEIQRRLKIGMTELTGELVSGLVNFLALLAASNHKGLWMMFTQSTGRDVLTWAVVRGICPWKVQMAPPPQTAAGL